MASNEQSNLHYQVHLIDLGRFAFFLVLCCRYNKTLILLSEIISEQSISSGFYLIMAATILCTLKLERILYA